MEIETTPTRILNCFDWDLLVVYRHQVLSTLLIEHRPLEPFLIQTHSLQSFKRKLVFNSHTWESPTLVIWNYLLSNLKTTNQRIQATYLLVRELTPIFHLSSQTQVCTEGNDSINRACSMKTIFVLKESKAKEVGASVSMFRSDLALAHRLPTFPFLLMVHVWKTNLSIVLCLSSLQPAVGISGQYLAAPRHFLMVSRQVCTGRGPVTG